MQYDSRLFERMAVLETKFQTMETEVSEINNKLDDLLALKAKGAGAFWLASSLFGVGFSFVVSFILDWFKG
jgi:hypothetical protein